MEGDSFRDIAKFGVVALVLAVSLAMRRRGQPPSTGFLLTCLGLSALAGGFAYVCHGQVQANHGNWGALPFLVAWMAAIVVGGGLLLAAVVEALRAVWHGLRG